MILVIGSKGLVSAAIQQQYVNQRLTVVPGDIAKTWVTSNAVGNISEYVNSLPFRPSRIINCAGLTDPKLPKQMLGDANFELPKNLLKFSQETEIDLITFGSIMENNPEICKENSYLMSKKMYFEYLRQSANGKSRQTHVQLHTLYGGKKIHPHMFLGQMLRAIQEGNDFKMTDGLQLREYHHIYDDIQALDRILGTKKGGIIEISHGEKLTLRTIAEHVFSEFKMMSQLKLGELPNPEVEQYVLGVNELPRKPVTGFRSSLRGITEHLRELLGKHN